MTAMRIRTARGTGSRTRLWGGSGSGVPEPLDDGGVGHAATLAHGLEAPAAAGALQLVEQGDHEPRARRAERVPERDRPAVHVDLAHVRVVLLLPREHDRCEGLVD